MDSIIKIVESILEDEIDALNGAKRRTIAKRICETLNLNNCFYLNLEEVKTGSRFIPE